MVSVRIKVLFILFVIFFCIFSITNFPDAYAADNGQEYGTEQRVSSLLGLDIRDLMKMDVVSATRGAKSLSETPQNMTVITAEEIELMNAHTVSQVLNTVVGVTVDSVQAGLGGNVNLTVLGAPENRVALFMDGIPLNTAISNFFEIGSLPVQNIERIEIIKGPGSSAWGSSLGGVINIITKSPGGDGLLNGTLSASNGSESTYDLRAEAYGRKNDIGYYFNAGRLHSDGLVPDSRFSGNNYQLKLSYDISKDTKILFNIFDQRAMRGEGQSQDFDTSDKRDVHTLLSNLSLTSALNKEIDLKVALWTSQHSERFTEDTLSTGLLSFTTYFREMKYGADAIVTWQHGMHNVVFGASYQDLISRSADQLINGREATTREAVYLNDTISWNKLAVTPGLRYDITNTNGNFLSPSLGATYKVTGDILLRALVERGFYTPSFDETFGSPGGYASPNPNLKNERVLSYQFGAEANVLDSLWLKVTAFRHNITDAITYTENPVTLFKDYENVGHRRIEGIETELKTSPFYNFSLHVGYVFLDTKDFSTGQGLTDPQCVFDIGLKYDDKKSFRALLQARYNWETNQPQYPYPSLQGKYDAFIVDLNLIKSLNLHEKFKPEIFFTAHNLFNGDQYLYEMYRNPRRWVEAGIRYKF